MTSNYKTEYNKRSSALSCSQHVETESLKHEHEMSELPLDFKYFFWRGGGVDSNLEGKIYACEHLDHKVEGLNPHFLPLCP